jgi:hypothetical protein
MDGSDPDGSRLRRTGRDVCNNRPSAGEECMPGRADNLSELVRIEPDDSVSTLRLEIAPVTIATTYGQAQVHSQLHKGTVLFLGPMYRLHYHALKN